MLFFGVGQHIFFICAQSNFFLNFFLNIVAIRDVPIKVAVQYSQRFPITTDNRAGANERDGIIGAPDTNAKKNMSKPTIATITIPPKPLKPFVYVTTRVL
jgi:hypothetical protein